MDDRVSICICTFRRPDLFDALDSLVDLRGLDPFAVNVIVVDNDVTDRLRTRVEAYAGRFRFELSYIHAPSQNISIARNAALASVRGRWAVFIDDDETADADWLSCLLASRENAAAVVGQCKATYAAQYPRWLERCDFHSNRITNDPVNAYTSNVLLDMHFLRKHRMTFRNELGQTGGEDTIFFREIDRAGGIIRYRSEAIVYEKVVPGRANMKWVRRRRYRAGQTHGLMCREFKPIAYRWLFVTSGVKAGVCFFMALMMIPGSDRSRRWVARGWLHLGAVAYRLRPHILKEYGGAADKAR